MSTTEVPTTSPTRVSVVVALGPTSLGGSIAPHLAKGPQALSVVVERLAGQVTRYPGAELIIVDDGGSQEVHAAVAPVRGRVRFVHNLAPRGTRGAQATGAALASGLIIVLVDPRQRLESRWLDAVCRPFDVDPGIGMVEARDAEADQLDADDRRPATVVALRHTALESIGGPGALQRPVGRVPIAGPADAPSKTSPLPEDSAPVPAGPEQPCGPLLDPAVGVELAAARWRRTVVTDLGASSQPTVLWPGDREAPSSTAVWRPPYLPATSRRGLNVVGLLEAACGIGDAGRRYVAAAESGGTPVSTFAVNLHSSPWIPYRRRGDEQFVHDTTLLVLNPELLGTFSVLAGSELWADRYTVGMWFWEVERLASHHRSGFEYLHELWVSSEFLQTAFARETDKPVVTVPMPVPRRDGTPPVDREAVGMPNAFTFLSVFDFGSLAPRKNGLGVVEAFCEAFDPGEGPVLVLKTINAPHDPTAYRALHNAIGGRRDVLLIEGYLSDEKLTSMIGHADCYVSLHRCEGFGLTPAEAMAWGRPVVATAYSGNLDFMTPANSYLVPFDLVDVPPSAAHIYPIGSRWAEPRRDAARALRTVWERRDQAAARGALGREDIRRTHGESTVARAIERRLSEIDRTLGRRVGPSSHGPIGPARLNRPEHRLASRLHR